MALSTNLISGLSSGFDWRSMIDKLIAVDHQRVDLMTEKKTSYESQLKEWQGVNTKLLALRTASTALAAESAFNVFKTSATSSSSTLAASDLLTVTGDSTASAGTYSIKVNNVAQAEKISSKSFATSDTALSLSGDILLSGKVVGVAATDTLASIKDKINALNTGSNPSGVTASIVSHSSTDYHLVLTSDETGLAGISVLEGSSDSLLETMGFVTGATALKNRTSNGAKSDLFSDSNTAAGTLLGLTSAPGDTAVTIGGQAVTLNLASDSITAIAQKIDALAGVSASVVSETVSGETQYRIQVSDTTSLTDSGNVLQILGFLEGTQGSTAEVLTGSKANTTDGATAIAAATQWNQIFGANVQAGTSFTLTGKKHDGTAVSGSFTISGTAATVQELLTYIQDTLFSGTVTAAIDSSGKIRITDGTTGDSRLELAVTTNNPSGGSLDFGTVSTSTEGRSMQLTAGEDAEVVVDNVTLTRSSNQITDVISGLTLDLTGESSSTTVTLKVERDLDSVKSKIQAMAAAYNAIIDYVNKQFSYNEETKATGGILFGDGTLSSVKSELVDTVREAVTGLSSDFNRLALIGITLDSDVRMTIDSDDLTDALESNFDDVKKLFIAAGSAPNTLFQYVGHTVNTNGGSYAVSITQPATQTTVTGSAALAGTLGSNETLTLQDYSAGRTATVSLTSAMTLDDVVNAVNSELAKEYTEKLYGSTGNTDKSASVITAATLFSNITGADAGDLITFAGTRRSGIAVSGNYSVSTTDTLGDLLEEIENMLGGDATASLDGSGKLVITDKQSGDSQLALTIVNPSVSGLDFGTVTSSNSGGVTGRYALDMTASKTGANKLLLTHNSYGTGHVITASESGGTALGLGDATVVFGKDMAGTINGTAATGSGQNLTLSSDGNNADGLSLLYAGSSTASTTFTLTLGIADLLERKLGFITDTDGGYVAFKQTSLQNSIDGYESQVDQLEALLNRKTEMMINRFVAMELALSKIQQQSNWLSQQLSSMTGA